MHLRDQLRSCDTVARALVWKSFIGSMTLGKSLDRLWASVSTWSYITAFFSSNISGLTLKCREAQTNKNPLKNSSSTLYHARYHFPMQHVSIATVTPGSVLSPGMQRWTTETLFSWSSLVILACVCFFFFSNRLYIFRKV